MGAAPAIVEPADAKCPGWHAAVCAGVQPGMSVVVVGDGAVGLSGDLGAARLGATTVIAMSRHEARQRIATAFCATHVVAERGEAGVAQVRDLTEEARLQAVQCTRRGHDRTGGRPPRRPDHRPAALVEQGHPRWIRAGPCLPAAPPWDERRATKVLLKP